MSRKIPLEAEDLDVLFDRVWKQLSEDRDSIKHAFEHLRDYVHENPQSRYEENGDTIAKMADVMSKQTSQLLELVKLAQKSQEKDEELSEEDFANIHKEIEDGLKGS